MAQDEGAFGTAFAQAWYKLTTRDMGPVTRCVGDAVPPAQPWQHPLPARPKDLADFELVEQELRIVMQTPNQALPPDEYVLFLLAPFVQWAKKSTLCT